MGGLEGLLDKTLMDGLSIAVRLGQFGVSDGLEEGFQSAVSFVVVHAQLPGSTCSREAAS